MRKRIGIDARLYFQTGVGVYLRNLLFYLQNASIGNLEFYIYVLATDRKKIVFKNKNFVIRPIEYRWHTVIEQLGFYNVLMGDNLDLMHFTYFSYPILYRRKFIATVHDMTPLLFKTGKASTKSPFVYNLKLLAFKKVLSSQVKNSLAIITPTVSVKNELINYFGQEISPKIYPVYEGVSHEFLDIKEKKSLERRFKKDFFIYVGNFYPHKNVLSLVRAFNQIKTNMELILLGPDDYFASRLYHYVNTVMHDTRIYFYHESTPQDLVFFYKNAKAIIHPSLSEGFGLPLVEAAYFNCPIIASDIPVFEEILGRNYLSFNPFDTDDIKAKIEEFIKTNPKFSYKQNLKKFSFAKMTEETLEIYKNYLE